jgi:hypothetical protein
VVEVEQSKHLQPTHMALVEQVVVGTQPILEVLLEL